jgi:hypothetical protein
MRRQWTLQSFWNISLIVPAIQKKSHFVLLIKRSSLESTRNETYIGCNAFAVSGRTFQEFPSGIKPTTFHLVAQCLTQLHYRVPPSLPQKMNYGENSSCWKWDTAENALCSARNMAFAFDWLHPNLHRLHLKGKTEVSIKFLLWQPKYRQK